MISLDQIKELRDRTGVSIAECKNALAASGGDVDKALSALRERGAAIAEKKSTRTIGAGIVGSYVHYDGKTAGLVALGCETDFVAKNPDFKVLADDLAMHAAAFAPADQAAMLEQPFIKDASLTIMQAIQQAIQKFGENIEIRKICRLDAGGN